MDPAIFDELKRTLAAEGPDAAVRRLCERLRENKDYSSLFYALLMHKRQQLGIMPIPTGPAADLPESAHTEYEEAIRQSGRQVGELYLQEGLLAQAWAYFRMLNEPEAVRRVLDAHEPKEDEDVQTLVQIAFYEGVHPRKGFDWILQRFGICNAITTLSSQEFSHPPEDRQYCLRALVRALYDELRERLAAEIERHDGSRPTETRIRELIAGRDWLFGDDCYHIDLSHLSSVAQMSMHLTPCPELEMVRELCEYGQRLSGRFVNPGDPPFEDLYRAIGIYLAILAGDNVEEGLDYFRRQAEQADPETIGTYPAQVLVNLLLRLERHEEALAVARKYLAAADNRQLSCPSIVELCRKVGDYRTLAEVAREQGDPVHFLAGLLAQSEPCP
jgi:tetratricopeptide (TPR) repeat protein